MHTVGARSRGGIRRSLKIVDPQLQNNGIIRAAALRNRIMPLKVRVRRRCTDKFVEMLSSRGVFLRVYLRVSVFNCWIFSETFKRDEWVWSSLIIITVNYSSLPTTLLTSKYKNCKGCLLKCTAVSVTRYLGI